MNLVSKVTYHIVLLIFGMLYPAYMSFKIIKLQNTEQYDRWLMYWVIFALIMGFECFADAFLEWIPLYYECKTTFTIWLLYPATRGSAILYQKYVAPFLSKNEDTIDIYVQVAREQGCTLALNFFRSFIRIFFNLVASNNSPLENSSQNVNLPIETIKAPCDDICDRQEESIDNIINKYRLASKVVIAKPKKRDKGVKSKSTKEKY